MDEFDSGRNCDDLSLLYAAVFTQFRRHPKRDTSYLIVSVAYMQNHEI